MKTQDIKNMGLAWQQVQEAGTATQKPNNGSDPEQGLSPNAKKEKARTSGVGVDANDSITKSFKAFRANSKTAKLNGGMGVPGDKAVVKSTMAPAANQKTESVKVDEMIPALAGMAVRAVAKKAVGKAMSKSSGSSNVAEVKQGKPIKGKIGDPIKAAYHSEHKKKPHKKDDKLDDGDGMDPVGKADADIDNDGDVDKADDYLNNRRDAIRSKMKGKSKAKKEDAVMHGGKGGAKSEKKEKEVMAVGNEAYGQSITSPTMRALAKADAQPKKKVSLPKAPWDKAKKEGAMKRMSSGDGMDTFKKKPKEEDMGKAIGHAMRATGEVGDSAVKGVARTVGYASGIKKGIKKAYADGKAKASDDDDDKKKIKSEAFSSSAIAKKPRTGDGKPLGGKLPSWMNTTRQMKDPKKDAMVSKGGKVKVIDKDKEKDHLNKGYTRAENVR